MFFMMTIRSLPNNKPIEERLVGFLRELNGVGQLNLEARDRSVTVVDVLFSRFIGFSSFKSATQGTIGTIA